MASMVMVMMEGVSSSSSSSSSSLGWTMSGGDMTGLERGHDTDVLKS